MKRFLILTFGFLIFFCLLPSSAEAQYSRASDILRQIEQRRIQVQICAENTQSDWAFQECLRGRPLVGVIEGNRALVDDVVDAGHGYDGYGGSVSDIVRGSVWGRGGDYRRRREERRAPRTIISSVEGGITSGVIVGAATGSLRNGVVTGAATYGGLRIVDAILERRERSRMEREERRQQEETRIQQQETAAVAALSASAGSEERYRMTNASPAYIKVYDVSASGKRFVFGMRSGEVRNNVPRPQGNYEARAQLPNKYGGISEGELEKSDDNDGWTFEEPAVARR